MKIYYLHADNKAVGDVSQWLKDSLLEVVKYPVQADLILVAGGDGTMLHAIHSLWQNDLPFLGINRGTVGFILNPIETEAQFNQLLESYQTIQLSMLEAEMKDQSGVVSKFNAFNDVYLNVSHGSVCYGSIEGSDYPREEFSGDGLIVATPQGSTAYNRNAGGSILPLQDNLLAITSICSNHPLRNVISKQNLAIEVSRGEVTATADNQSVAGVKSIIIRPNHGLVRLAFGNSYNFEKIRYSFYNHN